MFVWNDFADDDDDNDDDDNDDDENSLTLRVIISL